jgi:formylglycine-generating enzyme
MKKLLAIGLMLGCTAVVAQSLPTLKKIDGGTRNLGGGYQYGIQDYYMVLLGTDADYLKKNQDQIVIGEVPTENNPALRVTVASFYISETEVTTAQYRDFLIGKLLDIKQAASFRAKLKGMKNATADERRAAWQPLILQAADAGLLPDTSCWVTDFVFAYNEPLVKNYFWHPAFDEYPMVGVSWHQANEYCNWLTETVNLQRKAQGKPELPAYRLPTEMEWEYAAHGKLPETGKQQIGSDYPDHRGNYPWGGNNLTDDHGKYLANIKVDHGNYNGDGYEYTAPVRSFEPNSFGLYNMAGNASEWCMDAFVFHSMDAYKSNPVRQPGYQLFSTTEIPDDLHVVKGGSWADYRYAARVGSRMGFNENQGSSRIGFRVAQIIVNEPDAK